MGPRSPVLNRQCREDMEGAFEEDGADVAGESWLRVLVHRYRNLHPGATYRPMLKKKSVLFRVRTRVVAVVTLPSKVS